MNRLLIEAYVNLFTPKEKEKYADEVWDILQKSYAYIGGIKGSGFNNKEDMIANIPFWKLAKKDGKIVAARLYKDKNGRKAVAGGTDGSLEGKQMFAVMTRDDVLHKRSYGEVSAASLQFLIKRWKTNEKTKDIDIKQYMILPKDAEKILGEKVYYPVPDDDPEVQRHPEYKEFFYQREIGGHLHTKLMVGTPGEKIIGK